MVCPSSAVRGGRHMVSVQCGSPRTSHLLQQSVGLCVLCDVVWRCEVRGAEGRCAVWLSCAWVEGNSQWEGHFGVGPS